MHQRNIQPVYIQKTSQQDFDWNRYNSIFWLNAIPPRIDHHGTVSPRTLVTGIKHDVKKHCKAECWVICSGVQDLGTIDIPGAFKQADMDGHANTPASSHLSNVNLEDTKLDEKQNILFYHFVAKLLFLWKLAKPDLQTDLEFLSTRVKSLNSNEYKNFIQGCTIPMCYQWVTHSRLKQTGHTLSNGGSTHPIQYTLTWEATQVV